LSTFYFLTVSGIGLYVRESIAPVFLTKIILFNLSLVLFYEINKEVKCGDRNMIKTYLLNIEGLFDDKLFQDNFNIMSTYRQNKIRNYKFRIDQNLSLGAGILLNYGLQQYGLRELDMEYAIGINNKPYFLNKPDIRFNISHSGTMVICSFSDKEIGIDIEKITEGSIDIDIAKRFFCISEYEYIIRQNTSIKQKEAFYRLWVLKESFMKVTGIGMTLLFDSFEIVMEDNISVEQSVDDQKYFFKEYKVDDYRIALCSTIADQDDGVENCDCAIQFLCNSL
jgi:4'-phosphopantetheinyl transferase